MTQSLSNNPPTEIEFSKETVDELGKFLSEYPIIESEDNARAAKLLVDRASLCLKDMEQERTAKTAPLNEQIRTINDQYRSPRTILEKILTEIKERLNAWSKKETARRLEIVEAARRETAERERLAREAEAREYDAQDDARHGVVSDENDVVLRTREADAAFAAYQKAERETARAEKNVNVKIGGGLGPALSARFKETLVVTDAQQAVMVMGWSKRLLEAVLTDARLYRKEHGRLPEGVKSEGERKI